MEWLSPCVAGGAVGLLALAATRRFAAPAVVPRSALLLVAPTAYSATTSIAPVEGTFPAAGPKAAAGPGGYGVNARTSAVDRALVEYALGHHPGSALGAADGRLRHVRPDDPARLRRGALGGYSGTDPALDGAGLARLVRSGEARYVVLGGVYSTRGRQRGHAGGAPGLQAAAGIEWHSPDPYPTASALFDCAGRERALEGR